MTAMGANLSNVAWPGMGGKAPEAVSRRQKRSRADLGDEPTRPIVEISSGGGGPAVRGGRVAGGQQPRPAEQLLAQGTGQVITLVGAALRQDRND
jgi:hypothetical protein